MEILNCSSTVLQELEAAASTALGGPLNEKLDTLLIENSGRYRQYNYQAVRDILRVIRNKANQYRELPSDRQNSLGAIPQGYENYFRTRFPKLLMEIAETAEPRNSSVVHFMPTFNALRSSMDAALEALRNGGCVAILDSETREGEVDLFFPAAATTPAALRTLRTQAGGELYISIGSEVASTFGLPYIGQVLATPKLAKDHPVLQHTMKCTGPNMCQGSCSVGLSLDHRSLKTGAPDAERSFTCRRLAGLWEEHKGIDCEGVAAQAFGKEFHTPGHIFLCVENLSGLRVRQGHTELSVALARAAGIPPLMVGCVMLCNEGDSYGALGVDEAQDWAKVNRVPFLVGEEVVAVLAFK